MKKERIGIYGGSFSPPHLGHVHAARSFLEYESPDCLYIMPAFLPPHKELEGDASPSDRLAMCRLAFDFDPRIRVSDLEIRRAGKSYTSDTLSELTRPDRTLIFLCGTDMLLTMDTWHRPDIIFSLAEIVFERRENDPELTKKIRQKIDFYKRAFHAEIRELPAPPLPLSSSDCRENRMDDAFMKRVLPPAVWEYIKKCNLYRK